MSNTFHENEESSPSFPVIQSLLSPEALVTEILSDYDIGHVVDCRLLSHNLNDIYLVSTNECQYILRVSQAPPPTGRTWEGNQERRPLSEFDLQAIPLLVAVRHFWFLGLHTANWDYWGLSMVDDKFFDRELAFLREWVRQRIELS